MTPESEPEREWTDIHGKHLEALITVIQQEKLLAEIQMVAEYFSKRLEEYVPRAITYSLYDEYLKRGRTINAVAQLHQPLDDGTCEQCDPGTAYPCPTIQAIGEIQ